MHGKRYGMVVDSQVRSVATSFSSICLTQSGVGNLGGSLYCSTRSSSDLV